MPFAPWHGGAEADTSAACTQLFGHWTDGLNTATGTSGDKALDREEFITRYQGWLSQRLVEVSAMKGTEQSDTVRGLLQQLEGILSGMQRGLYPDPQTLDPCPTSSSNTYGSAVHWSMPPQLIGFVRRLIELVERPAPGRTAGSNPEAARDGSGTDWNTRLGVPQYRTQSDNLAGPETTCSVTSMAMVLERLGYGRPDVMAAIGDALRRRYWKEQHPKLKRGPTEAELASLALPADYFQQQVKLYLQEENERDSPYKRPRGVGLTTGEGKTKDQVESVSSEYEQSAQMEDLLDFLRYLKAWGDREGFLSNSNAIIDTLDPRGEDRPRMEQIDRGCQAWPVVKERMCQCLDDGGAVMLSIFHKGHGNDSKGSHIITVQSVEATGLRVDDPYGAIRNTYDYAAVGSEDAFSPSGSRTPKDRTDEYRNVVDRSAKGESDTDGVGDDWKVEQAQELHDNESLGDSHFIPDTVFDAPNPNHLDSWHYVRLFARPSADGGSAANRGAADAREAHGQRH